MTIFLRKISFLIIAISLFSGCKKEETDISDSTSEEDQPTAAYYFSAKLDGTSVLHEHNDTGQELANGVAGDVYDRFPEDEFYTVQETNFSNLFDRINDTYNHPRYEVGLTFVTTEEPTTTADYDDLIKLKTYTYGHRHEEDSSIEEVPGAYVSYTDTSGTYWATDGGTANQSASSFSVVEYIDNPNQNNDNLPKIIKVNFSCTLYDNSGNSITVTNGVVRGRFISPY